jgi:diacylglycerol kinase
VAFRGLGQAIVEERNLKIHLAVSLAVVICGALVRTSNTGWLLLTLCIGSVISLELMNTAVETVVDLVSPGENELARKAKDTAAAGVLIGAIAAAIVGTRILVVPILRAWL